MEPQSYSTKTSLLRLLAYVLAAVVGACFGLAVFYVVYLFPSWFTKQDILLAWSWVGVPLGFVFGIATLGLITSYWGSFAADLVTPIERRLATKEALAARVQSEHVTAAISAAFAAVRAGTAIEAYCPVCRSRIRSRTSSTAKSHVFFECQCKACNGVFEGAKDA